MIFEGGKPLPVMSFEMPGIVSALVPLHGSAGYVVLGTNSEFRIISPKMAAMLPPTSTVGDAEPVLDLEREETDEDAEMEEEDEAGPGANRVTDEMELEVGDIDLEDHMAGDKLVVRPEQLAEVLNPGSSFALPSVKDLFNAVVGLYARKSEA
jgi:NET1-associated nuclear protein 1 (U3 small nucleolar RNA-associated protein 17)